MRWKPLALLAIAASFLSACGHDPAGAGTGGLTPSTDRAGGTRIAAKLHFTISGRHRRPVRGHGRKPHFVSASTAGILVQVYPHGDAHVSFNLINSVAVDVAPGAPACNGATGFPRTCTASISLPITRTTGDDFVVTTFDGPPAGGSFAAYNALGYGVLSDQFIRVGKNNAFTVAIGGVVAGLSGNPAFTSLPADGSPHSLGIVIDAADFDINTIATTPTTPFANPIQVTVSEKNGSGHMLLSLDGGTPASEVTVQYATDTVQVEYDGGGSPGYAGVVTLTSQKFQNITATENVDVSPMYLTSSAISSGVLALDGNGDVEDLDLSEHGAPATVDYTIARSSCSAIADTAPLGSASGSSATFAVLARGTISTPAPGSGCELALSDGTSTIDVPVTNSYSGIVGTSPTLADYSLTTPSSSPIGITAGPDGRLWFAECAVAQLGSAIPNGAGTPTLAEYSLPSEPNPQNPTGVSGGPDGNIWWADVSNGVVGRMTTSGSGTAYNTQSSSSRSAYIVTGPDNAMWFTENGSGGNAIGRFTVAPSPSPSYVSLAHAASIPLEIVTGADGNVWFTESANNKIGKITPGGTLTEFSIPSSSSEPTGITAGPDGALWFTEAAAGAPKIGRIPTSATTGTPGITEYDVAYASPADITTGPDGQIWFTLTTRGSIMSLNIGNASTTGVGVGMTEYSIATTNSDPQGIASGPDGAIWFTESGSAKIGRIALSTSSSIRHAHAPRPPHHSKQ